MTIRKLAAMLTLLAMVAALMPLTASVALGTGGNNPPDACYEQVEEHDWIRYFVQKRAYPDGNVSGSVGDAYWIAADRVVSRNPLTINPLGTHAEARIVDVSRFNVSGGGVYGPNVPDGDYIYRLKDTEYASGVNAPVGIGWIDLGPNGNFVNGEQIDCEITDPTFDVTPESLVCNPQTGEIEGQNDGAITFHSFANGSWDAIDQTGLSAGFYGPFWATSDPGYIFASTGTDTFSTGEVEVKAVGDEEPCDELVTAVEPGQEQSQECGVEGTLTIPDTEGVQYLLDGEPIAAGDHTGPISGTLTAEAKDGYELTNPDFSVEVDIAAAEECPTVVTPVDPELVEASECGVPDRLIVPETGGVEYLLNGEDVSGQTLEGPLSGTIVAQPKAGHVFDGEQTVEYQFDLAGPEACPIAPFCLDINTATLDELIQVNGLDATLAQAVIDGRPYESIDHMVEVVKGIGPVSVLPMMEPDSETGAFISDDCLTVEKPPTTPTTEPTTPTTEPPTSTTEPEPTTTTVPETTTTEPEEETPSTLPFTGDSTGSLAGVALIALVTGLGLVALSRKREVTLD